ncbi:hypothetical protein LWI28_010236 [Acer negundo]|uniref:Uncharacterized protein n=1 Tax=Acer negundo TaxID=4023 RepID=A0AAD5NQ02_ACENE|nr:hypothetical protein LWI28_010236 [Acer negundo]
MQRTYTIQGKCQQQKLLPSSSLHHDQFEAVQVAAQRLQVSASSRSFFLRLLCITISLKLFKLLLNGCRHKMRVAYDPAESRDDDALTDKHLLLRKAILPSIGLDPIQFLTSGGGSKAWRRVIDYDKLTKTETKFYYDGQDFMPVVVKQDQADIKFYNVFGQVLHTLNLSNHLRAAAYDSFAFATY